jgi:hypothetical protein
MTPMYNQYVRFNNHKDYESKIAFINSKKTVATYNVFYVEFSQQTEKYRNGFYKDTDNFLRSIVCGNHKHIKINKVQHVTQYFSYIKIIKDVQNPQLEGQIMIFKFGRNIYEALQDKILDEVFRLSMRNIAGFPNYDHSHFTGRTLSETEITDLSLDIDSEISFKTFNIKEIEREEKLKEREEKLKNIKSEIELKQFRYEEYLKLKEEFENEI